MNKAKLVDKLNEAIGYELAGLLQYNQYAQVLLGEDRQIWRKYFLHQTEESLEHAQKFAERVVANGGVPCVEPATVKQATDVKDMLINSLAILQRDLG
jgi:bacterioferritin (cytochrome b1)